ncbi:glycine cleavage system aminomethyltransferase GcvT [Inquilinus limosus]|uniref:glycine cleavage system aminomethyltransferase GcvT n=1 Tax=Inquilinus limosus TaxID=171674 RepID=UPI003F187C0B
MTDTPLQRTPLFDLHVELGAKLVPFAGYEMPVQYPAGILKEHLHTRAEAGLFDVSHMGQAWLEAEPGEDVAALIETLVPGDIAGLAPGRIRYSLLLNDEGGILDDLMITRSPDPALLFLVVNAACKDADFAHIATKLAGRARLVRLDDRALIALQGPKAAEVLARHAFGADDLAFMESGSFALDRVECLISRSGYTGEDGFEISAPAEEAERIARFLLSEPEVAPIGLGARDSLRLEAGLCLYGHDIDTTTTPVEAGLAWTIGKRRRAEGGFPGADRILKQLAEGPARKRVGLKPEGRAPAREGTPILSSDGREIGRVTSGGFGPTVGGPVAMGYVEAGFAAAGTPVSLLIRDKAHPAVVAALPFVAPNFHR